MNPDDLTITIPSTIGGACLLILLTALLVLRYREPLEQLLRIQRHPQRPAPFPLHYVIPYAEPVRGQTMTNMEPVELAQEQLDGPHRRRLTSTNSSDEFLLRAREPRNATPGPSNVPRTPSPPVSLISAMELERNLWIDGEIEPPPDYTPAPIPRAPQRLLLPERARIRVLVPHPRFSTATRPIRPPTPRAPFPDDASSSDSDIHDVPHTARRTVNALRSNNPDTPDPSQPETIIIHDDDPNGPDPFLDALPHPPQDPNDVFNVNSHDYEWPALSNRDIHLLGPHQTEAWELRRQDVEYRAMFFEPGPCTSMDEYLARNRGDPILSPGTEATVMARIFANRERDRYPPAPGRRLERLRPRTEREQEVIEDLL
ncbi:hypothetical protein EV421DRAFT_1970150 [Armillaria borealis]|uniref:Uncharacterized protein n=1 Tax=Armillaria borealis TaxID=47425 RepID=A0AA39JBL7_9AGAR|nr:hypothetical protein EV421DRAFT_1970150 [Armillaria borealis]